MIKYDNLSKKELREKLLRMSPETLKEFAELDKADSWLLELNLQEMKREERESELDSKMGE
ncbi:MAG: hypothetical protein WC460_06035 [Patescibacteria group bacterium]